MIGRSSRRTEQAFSKLWVLFVRQSSRYQWQHNQGSGDVQMEQMAYVEQMQVPSERVVTIDARGETGRAEVERTHYQELVRLLESGTVGVLVLARFDRVGRNREDSDLVLRLLAKCGGIVLIDGKIYDPRQPTDGFSLDMLNSYAEFENRSRVLWMMDARLRMARRMRTGIPLATGLTWINIRDSVAVGRLRSAGLESWLERLNEHRAYSGRDTEPRYVLPYPDRAVYEAAHMRLEWLLETQDLAQVRARIRDPQSGWPRPGLVPTIRSSVYASHKPLLWVPIEQAVVADWYRSPSLYGVYSYRGHALSEQDDVPLDEMTVWEPDAFPAFATLDDHARVVAILARGAGKPWMRKVEHVPHLLPNVRCGQQRENGKVCGRRMTACGEGGEARYVTQCAHASPGGSISRLIESPVLAVIAGALRPDTVRASLQTLRVERDAVLVRRAEMTTRHQALLAQARAARDLVIEERVKGTGPAVTAYMERQRELETEALAVGRDLARLEAEEREVRGATEADYARIIAMASDLPRLLEAAMTQPETMRRLVGELTEAVHVRPIAHGVVEVQVEFPTGIRRRTVVETYPTQSSQAERVYAARRLEAGVSPEQISHELNEALSALRQRAPSNRPFSDRQIATMAAMHREGGDEPAREGAGLSPSDVAERYGVPEAEAREAVLRGRLGPAGWSERAELTVVPTDEEAVRAFPTWARTLVAQARGWPAADVVRVEDMVRELGITRTEVLRRAGRCSGRATFPRRRLWVRRSEVTDPDAALRARLREARPDLDPGPWERLTAASERLGLSRYQLRQHCEVVSIAWSPSSESAVYVWLGPGVLDHLQGRSVEQELADRAPGVDPSEFVSLGTLIRDLARRTGTNMEWRFRTAVADGCITSVTVPRQGRGSQTDTYVRVPQHVREADDKTVVVSWLKSARQVVSAP